MGITSSLVTQDTVGLSSDFTLFFCVCSILKQPHNILQKRLMETNLSKFRGSRGSWTPKGDLSSQTNKLNQTKLDSSGKTEELIVVSCQVRVPPQPSVVLFAADFISNSFRLCSCSPCFPVRFVLPWDSHSCGDALPLQLQAAVVEIPTWESLRELV